MVNDVSECLKDLSLCGHSFEYAKYSICLEKKQEKQDAFVKRYALAIYTVHFEKLFHKVKRA